MLVLLCVCKISQHPSSIIYMDIIIAARKITIMTIITVGSKYIYTSVVESCLYSVMCQLPTGTNYRKSRANYRHIVYVWSTDKFTERGRAISGRSIEAYPPVFDFARFLDSEALSKAISHSLGCK